jgi:hypothetical protein
VEVEFRDSCSAGEASIMHYCMDGARGDSEHVTHEHGGGGSGHAAVDCTRGPYLTRNGMRRRQSSTQNGPPNLMRHCPSLSMRSSLLGWREGASVDEFNHKVIESKH